MRTLEDYDWPGNVRELRNVLERAVALCPGPQVQRGDLPEAIRSAGPASPAGVAGWRWVHRQRERQLAWADIARSAAGAGHDVGEEALRMRYRRWREKSGPPSGDPPPAA
jgi:DNA-binding NtrC family response regulator